MAAKTSWHSYGTKLRHGHPMYSAASLCAARDVTDCNRRTSVVSLRVHSLSVCQQWPFRAGAARHRTLQIVARPPNLAVLLIRSGQLLLGIISKSDATRCQILRLKCTKFDIRWGSAQDPAEEAYSALPDPLIEYQLRLG